MNRTTLNGTLLIAIMLLFVDSVVGQQLPLLVEEEQAMSNTFQYALEYNKTNQVADWVNPETGRTGIVVPVHTFIDNQARPCREYVATITSNGRQQQSSGTACRQPNGIWYTVSDGPPTRVSVVANRPMQTYIPPKHYYVPPHTYYNPYPIYFSFSYLFHGGSFSIGNYYPSGPMWYPRSPWQYKRYRHIDPFRHRHRPHHRSHIRH